MPLTPDQKAEIDAYLASVITKVRIPELAPFSTYGELTLADRSPIWMASVNKTVWVDQQTLKELLITGGTGSVIPVLIGDTIVHDVTAAEAGGTAINEPSLAGKSVFIRAEGRPFDATEYEILSSGGAKILIPGYSLVEGQRFDLQVYELRAGGGGGGVIAPGASPFITGVLEVGNNTPISATNDMRKLVQVRAVGNKVTITLPDIALVAENSYIPIEAAINNDYQAKVITSGGQYIYFNNDSKNAVYLGAGETLWLFRGDDGWYVINEFGKNYLDLGKPHAAYKVGLNELICKGQLVNRADYPRLWESVQTFSGAIVSDTVWSTPEVTFNGGSLLKPFRGFWSHGDGSTTFRLPDLRNMALRGLLAETGDDPLRFRNIPGGYQADSVGEHDHLVYGQDNDGVQTGTASPEVANVQNPEDPTAHYSRRTGKHNVGGESAMKNIGILWVVKY